MRQYFAILSLFACLNAVQAQWVTTVAGVLETPGFNDGPALSARFFNPHGIAADSSGRIYVADRFNHTIRMFDTNTGLVTTLAGKAGETGTANGIGAAARFNEPWGICATPSGIVYVADTKNNKIRKILPDGTVSTVAGSGNFGTTDGPALTASFGNPTGIEINDAGTLYVADHLTHIIRKIAPTGTVSTLAGTAFIPGDVDGSGTNAQFWRPYGLALDLQGNILVADEWNHKIRKVTPQGVVTTVAGNGLVALTDGATADASFNYPWDITVDPVGNIYVADGYNYVIRKIGTDGMVSSLVGSPQASGGEDGEGNAASFSGATSIAWSTKAGNLFVADAYNHLIRSITLDGAPVATLSLLNLNGGEAICEGDPFSVQAVPASYEHYQFFLDGGLAQDNNSVNFEASNLSVGVHTIVVEAMFMGGILSSNTIDLTVTALPQPTISAVGPLSFYKGDSVILVATGVGAFLWSNGDTTQAITVMESGTYFVEVTVNGCMGISEELVVEAKPLPSAVTVTVNGKNLLCPGETTQLVSSATDGNQWLKDGWPIAGQTSQSIEISGGGIYRSQVLDIASNITTLSNEVVISLSPTPKFDFSATPRIGKLGEEVKFGSTGADTPASFLWDFGAANATSTLPSPMHIYEAQGLYSIRLVATDTNGCEAEVLKTDFVQIATDTITPIVDGIFIPNAFSPNGDGENDVFRVRGPIDGSFNMVIFNQWGEQLFQSGSAELGWDGNRNGAPVHSGTYVYQVAIETATGTKQISGHVTLLR